eukprot:241608-Amphidinium_carterae.1
MGRPLGIKQDLGSPAGALPTGHWLVLRWEACSTTCASITAVSEMTQISHQMHRALMRLWTKEPGFICTPPLHASLVGTPPCSKAIKAQNNKPPRRPTSH